MVVRMVLATCQNTFPSDVEDSMTVVLRTAAVLAGLSFSVLGNATDLAVPIQADESSAQGSPSTAMAHCDLRSASFSHCLATLGPSAVRRDPNAPAAIATVRITVRDQLTGEVNVATVLAPASKEISDAIGDLRFSLTLQPAENGEDRVGFRFSGDQEVNDSKDFKVGESHVLTVEHSTVTIARL
jgi:hypothetical protein